MTSEHFIALQHLVRAQRNERLSSTKEDEIREKILFHQNALVKELQEAKIIDEDLQRILNEALLIGQV